MKKTFLFLIATLFIVGCQKDYIKPYVESNVSEKLTISNSVGIKLENSFVTEQVSMNVKLEKEGIVVIKIFDIGNRVVSKETALVKAGNNILTVYTKVLPSSAYRIALFDVNNNQLGITDFNKL
jgi:hypothetical protein